MLLSCPGCHGIQSLKLCYINETKKGLARHLLATQLHCLFIYSIDTHFSSRNRFELLNVRAIYGCRQAVRN